jgi:hypothetical protein
VIFLVFSSDSFILRGERAAVRTRDHAPAIEISLPSDVDLDDVVLLRMQAKDGTRSVGRYESKETYDKSNIVPVTFKAVAGVESSRTFRATMTSLSPGEYAVAIGGIFYAFGVN